MLRCAPGSAMMAAFEVTGPCSAGSAVRHRLGASCSDAVYARFSRHSVSDPAMADVVPSFWEPALG